MSERHAPEGKVWLCMMCGKTAKDSYGEEQGWDESCALNCILVDETTKAATEEQAREFASEWERRMEQCRRNSAELLASFKDGTWKPNPELLAIAEKIEREKSASSVTQGSEGGERG